MKVSEAKRAYRLQERMRLVQEQRESGQMVMSIEFPIVVESLDIDNGFSLHRPGGLAEVRPCGSEYEGKTYIGLFLGDLPTGPYVTYHNQFWYICYRTAEDHLWCGIMVAQD